VDAAGKLSKRSLFRLYAKGRSPTSILYAVPLMLVAEVDLHRRSPGMHAFVTTQATALSQSKTDPRRMHPPRNGRRFMLRMCAQGDILIESVDDAPLSGCILHATDTGAVVVAEGELTGHHHRLFGSATLFRDDALARDIPDNLYVGHVKAYGPAQLRHEEHAPITLEPGTYRVRRQRHLEPSDSDILGD
jgi:hypothetical protein